MKRQVFVVFLFLSLMLSFGHSVLAEAPPSTIEVDIPEYGVERIDGWDYAEIPGGEILLEEVRRDGSVCQTYDHYLPRPDGTSARDFGTELITSGMPNKDVFFLLAHANRGAWTELVTGDFGDSHPVILALACLTGAYEPKPVDPALGNFVSDYGAPEASFNAGAAVLIGATEVSIADSEHGSALAREFFADYWLPGTSCGDALTRLKDWIFTYHAGDEGWTFTAYEFNLYGDQSLGNNDSKSEDE